MALIRIPHCRSSRSLRAPLFAAALAASALLAALPAAAQQPSPGSAGSMVADKLSPSATDAGLSADLFYKLLLAEVALQRGELPVAARAYFEAARESRDPRVARRAT